MVKFLLSLFCLTTFCMLSSFGSPSRYITDSKKFRTGTNDEQQTNDTEMPETTPDANYMRPNICECSDIYDPVCGSNDKSYYNLCQMECELGPNTDVTIIHQGNCIPY